jgi:hypothetical protein
MKISQDRFTCSIIPPICNGRGFAESFHSQYRLRLARLNKSKEIELAIRLKLYFTGFANSVFCESRRDDTASEKAILRLLRFLKE